MNNKMKKLLKLIYSIIVMFVWINLLAYPQVYAKNPFENPVLATLGKGAFAFFGVLATGFFTILLTITGIQYFTTVSVREKADMKNRLAWIIFMGVLVFVVLILVSKAIGL